MYAIIEDRAFWIYFVVTLFFTIIGVTIIAASDDYYLILIVLAWMFSNVLLMILAYHASIKWGPICNNKYYQICFLDNNNHCFDPSYRTWFFINILFVLLLIVGVLWAGELINSDGSPLLTMSGVLMILGGLVLCNLVRENENKMLSPIAIAIIYLVIWFGLTFYVVTK